MAAMALGIVGLYGAAAAAIRWVDRKHCDFANRTAGDHD